MNRLRLYGFLALLLGVMGLSGWAGYRFHPSCPTSSIDKSTSVATKEEIIETRPDGTKIEKRKETTTVDSKKQIVPKYNPPKWSAGVDVRAPYNKLNDYHYTGYLYHRVGDTGLWGGAGISSKKELLLGIRIDF